jgi:hypothetical protein
MLFILAILAPLALGPPIECNGVIGQPYQVENFRERQIESAKDAVAAAHEQLGDWGRPKTSDRVWSRMLKIKRGSDKWLLAGVAMGMRVEIELNAGTGRMGCFSIID